MASRINSQVTLQILFDQIEARDSQLLREKFGILKNCLMLTEHNSAAVKHRQEKLENFYFLAFHPLRHFSLESIFTGFLANAGVAHDEWIDPSMFTTEIQQHVQHNVELKRLDEGDKLMNAYVAVDPLAAPMTDNRSSDMIDVQKKIMPWKLLPPVEDLLWQSTYKHHKQSTTGQLIVCATLVDKLTNLGGLCRTCEVFGVETFAIGSMRYLEEQQFKSLSVSAEKWVDIEQVMPVKLEQYLEDSKKEGYTIVGLEQTANSKTIQEYEFKPKTLLLLGNEKTGIPVNLIQLVDDCIEIPQQGLIRSLNVHVSGGIAIWEYSRQHLPMNT